MIVKIQRGKPVSKEVSIDTEQVECTYPRGRGGVIELKSGAEMALSGDEWRQWLEAVALQTVENWIEPEVGGSMKVAFTKAVHDARGKYGKGMIR